MTFSEPALPSVVGVFDSGVGGLSVRREVRAALPAARLVYLGDSAHIPYGGKSAEFIQRRAETISRFLLGRGAHVLVVACNSATAAAVAQLRARFPVPIVGMEPGVKVAAARTRTGVVGVLATATTLASQKFAQLVRQHAGSAQVVVHACHGWVEHVERADVHSAQVRALVRRDIEPVLARGADTLVLGCTHFPFLIDTIRAAAGPAVTLVDTGVPVANEVKRRLQSLTPSPAIAASGPLDEYWTSGDPELATEIYSALLGSAVTVQRVPREYL